MDKKGKFTLIIDFDSTFISKEGLDELAQVALEQSPKKQDIIAKIGDITKQAMQGTIGFAEALEQRLALFSPNQNHIEETLAILKTSVSQSFVEAQDFIREHAENICILSGGFKQLILPIILEYGLLEQNLYANEFVMHENGSYSGYNRQNLLAQSFGKVRQLKQLSIAKPVFMLGDGYTDYEVKLHGQAEYFIVFTENIRREGVIAHADCVANSLQQAIEFIYSKTTL